MFPRPNFCCSCGEKIERIEWHIWTSRRFCELCEIEHRPAEWLPRAVAAALLLFGLYGIGSALREPAREYDIAHSPVELARQRALSSGSTSVVRELPEQLPVVASPQEEGPGQLPPGPASDPEASAGGKAQKIEPDRYFYCGAATKKGTPCTRKVKGGGRCWQHKGRAAILPESELEIKPENVY